jgi:adenylate cyclase
MAGDGVASWVQNSHSDVGRLATQVFQKQHPRVLGVVQLCGAAGLLPEDVVDILEGLLEGEPTTDACRRFGILRKTDYKMFDRCKEQGLAALTDRSRRPVRSDQAVAVEQLDTSGGAPGRRRRSLVPPVTGSYALSMARRLALELSLMHWLLSDARRIAEPKAFLAALAEQLLNHGIEVARLTTGVPILHPQVDSYGARWELDKDVTERFYRITAESLPVLENSPVKTVYAGGGSVRCDPTAPPRNGEFGILADLRRDGMTDYVALSIPFSDGTTKLLSVATKRPGGFSDEEMELFEAITPGVAVNLEVQALRLTARTLLETYVGRQAGARVLDGAIRRGMGETTRAVIWLSDLRGFTSFSERLPRDAVIDLLNAYFDRMCAAVDTSGGEVLKFLGDALLAIFPVRDDDPPAVCARALEAAGNAQEALAAFNVGRIDAGEARIDHGIALHVGDVMYGNIGGEKRLDFTVIGPAVNLVARIEGLCRDLARPLLLSADFVAASGLPAQYLGAFSLRGLSDPQDVYAPPEGRREVA